MLKIAIPVADEKLCLHFGHCDVFAIYDVDESNNKIIKATELTPPPHEPGVLPCWMEEQGVGLVIAGGMGARAQGLFDEKKIKVITGASVDYPVKIVEKYLTGSLKTGENVCDH